MIKQLPVAAAVALFAASGASATAAPTPASRPATTAPAAQQQPAPTRAALLRNLDQSFKNVDTNGDGVLTQPEVAAAEAKSVQQRLAEVRQRLDAEFTKLDTNHDGQISKAEFLAAGPQAPTTAPNGSNLIAQLDKNKDGKISADEYRAPFLGRFDKADTNHDGTLSPTERQAAAAQRPVRKK